MISLLTGHGETCWNVFIWNHWGCWSAEAASFSNTMMSLNCSSDYRQQDHLNACTKSKGKQFEHDVLPRNVNLSWILDLIIRYCSYEHIYTCRVSQGSVRTASITGNSVAALLQYYSGIFIRMCRFDKVIEKIINVDTFISPTVSRKFVASSPARRPYVCRPEKFHRNMFTTNWVVLVTNKHTQYTYEPTR